MKQISQSQPHLFGLWIPNSSNSNLILYILALPCAYSPEYFLYTNHAGMYAIKLRRPLSGIQDCPEQLQRATCCGGPGGGGPPDHGRGVVSIHESSDNMATSASSRFSRPALPHDTLSAIVSKP